MKFSKPILILIIIFSLFASALVTTASASDGFYGIENRYTYTRWYEYPGTYYEEEFVLNGVQAGYFFGGTDASPITVRYGGQATAFPLAWYTSWPDDSASAMGLSIGLLSHIDYSVNSNFGIAARAGINYLAAIGFGGDNTYHQETFGSYLPTVDIGLGVRLKSLNIFGSDGLSIFYNFSIIGLGVWTDNYWTGDPVSENWNNHSFTVALDFGY